MYVFIIFLNLAAASISKDDTLSMLDEYLNKTTLKQDFAMDQTAHMVQVSCITSSICDTFRKYQKVSAVTDEYVEITVYSTTGAQQSVSKIMTSTWREKKGNLVRLLIANKESYGFQMEIDSVQPTKMTVFMENQKKEVNGYMVSLKGVNGAGQTIRDTFTITNEILGLGQMLDHAWKNSMTPQGSDRFYLEKIN